MPVLNWRQLRAINDQNQTGEIPYADTEAFANWDPNKEGAQEEYFETLRDNIGASRGTVAERNAETNMARELDLAHPDYSPEQIAASGYGQYRNDRKLPFDIWINNPQDYRANIQRNLAKLANGIVKSIPYAISTFADNTVGLLMGLGGLAGYGVDVATGEKDFKGSELADSFIDTKWANWMQNARDFSDNLLPNYRTTEEEADQDEWWKHLNANFWGDTFIKNLGFTIGAGGSGALYAKAFNKLAGKTANEAYKAAFAAAQGDAEMEDAFRRILQGEKFKNNSDIYKQFAAVHRKYNRLGWETNLVGGLTGAIGEARVEAINAAKEFRDEQALLNQQRYEQAKLALQNEIMQNDDFLSEVPVYDGFGNIVDTEMSLNADGENYRTQKMAELQEQYLNRNNAIEREAEALANTTFFPNMLLLSGSNIVMFGRMFSGGFKSQNNIKLRGKLGNLRGGGSLAKDIFRGVVKNAGTEGLEELGQKMISEGAKDIASKNIAAFNDGKHDRISIKDTAETVLSMLDSAGNVLFDSSSWMEFAVGALTGALGMPAGRNKIWTGGVPGAILEGRENREHARELAESLNKRFNDPKFKALWEGMVRHNYYENIKDVALDSKVNGKGDALKDKDGNEVGRQFVWQTANDAQIINDVMMFAEAGRLDELENIVDSFAQIDENDLSNIDALISDETDSEFAKKSTEQKLAWLHERANSVKKAIDQYHNFYDSIDFLSFGTTDKSAIQELIFTQSQLQNFEERYGKLLDETIDAIRPTIENIANETKPGGEPTDRALLANEVLSSKANLQSIFGGRAIDIKARAQDKNPGIIGWSSAILDDHQQEKVLKQLDEWGAFTDKPELKERVKDLQSLVRARQNFYAKLFDPRGRQSFAKSFKAAAKTDSEVAVEIDNEARSKKVDEYIEKLSAANSIGEYIQIYDSLDDMDRDTFGQFNSKIQGNPKLKAFEDTIRKTDDFIESIREEIANSSGRIKPDQIRSLEQLAEAVNSLESSDVLSGLADGSDPLVETARVILNSLPDPIAQKIASEILTEKLGDAAQAAGLGEVPGDTEVVEEGDGGDGGEQNDGDPLDRANKVISSITDVNSTTLKNLINGDYSEFPGLSEEQQLNLSVIAKEKLLELEEQNGLVSDVSDKDEPRIERDDDDPKSIKASEDFVLQESGAIGGTPFSIYDPKELKNGRKKRFVPKAGTWTASTISWWIKHNIQQFIDSGALARLDDAYRQDGKRLPIYFLANPHYVDNNMDNNPFVTTYKDKDGKTQVAPNILMAIEMSDENREILSAFSDLISEDALIEADGKKYQIVGEVWRPTDAQIKSKSNGDENIKKRYDAAKANAEKLWEYVVMNSVLPQYRADLDSAGSGAFTTDGRWYVGKVHPKADVEGSEAGNNNLSAGNAIYSTLNYIMSGRNETRKLGTEKYEKIPIRDSLKDYEGHGGEYYFGMRARGEDVYTDECPATLDAINAPAGSLWITTQAANGSWEWNYITIARTDEYDFGEDNELNRRINSALGKIFKPFDYSQSKEQRQIDHKNRRDACNDLTNLIYLGTGNSVRFFFEGDHVGLSIGGLVCYSRDDVIDALRSNKYRFQVSVDSLNDEAKIGMLIDAGVLRSEMRSFTRMGANIGINFISDRDADNNLVDPYPIDSRLPVARTSGSNAVSVWQAGEQNNIRIGDAGYKINKDGTVSRMVSRFKTGEEVENKELVAQVKAIAELINLDDAGKLSEYTGRRWKFEVEGYAYDEMYETEIDGIVVHIIRNSKNGAFQLAYSDELWEQMMAHSQPVEKKGMRFVNDEKPETDVEEMDRLQKQLDKQLAEEQGGTVGPPPKKKLSAGRGARLKAQREKATNRTAKTVQKASKDNAKAEEKNNCG